MLPARITCGVRSQAAYGACSGEPMPYARSMKSSWSKPIQEWPERGGGPCHERPASIGPASRQEEPQRREQGVYGLELEQVSCRGGSGPDGTGSARRMQRRSRMMEADPTTPGAARGRRHRGGRTRHHQRAGGGGAPRRRRPRPAVRAGRGGCVRQHRRIDLGATCRLLRERVPGGRAGDLRPWCSSPRRTARWRRAELESARAGGVRPGALAGRRAGRSSSVLSGPAPSPAHGVASSVGSAASRGRRRTCRYGHASHCSALDASARPADLDEATVSSSSATIPPRSSTLGPDFAALATSASSAS